MSKTERFYSRITPAAAAAIVFGLMPDDSDEAKRVVSTVARELRAVPVQEFCNALLWLQAVEAAWGVVHWRLKAEYGKACGALVAANSDLDIIGAAEAVRACEGRLLACERAIDEAADEGGFDAQVVLDAALTVRFQPMHPGAIVDTEVAAMLRDAFRPLAATARV